MEDNDRRKGYVGCVGMGKASRSLMFVLAVWVSALATLIAQETVTKSPDDTYGEIMSNYWLDESRAQATRDLEEFAIANPTYRFADEALYWAAVALWKAQDYAGVERVVSLLEERFPTAEMNVGYFVSGFKGYYSPLPGVVEARRE